MSRELGLVVALCWLGAAAASPARLVEAAGLDLTLLHVNDMHARYEQTNALSGSCSDKDAQAGHCYGGQARVATIVKQARAADPNVLVLNAGDMYQGTVYYSVFKSSISAEFINIMKYDAITLGNHEFDDKTVGLVPFIEQLKVPLVVANADFSQQPELNKLNIKKSVVVEKGGVKIGIIGYLTPETAFLSSPENVKFLDEVEALKAEATALKAQGVNIIIGLGHSGYDKDKVIAREVPDIDIVVGGHSHSFLFGKSATDAPPDSDVPVGLYPTWIEQASGRKVPVVQAYAFTKYMGSLKLKFDANGELTNLEGGPILLNKDVEEDKDTLAEVLKWKSQLDEKVLQPIGRTTVLLDGSSCRRQECNLGNLIADAFVYSRAVNVRSEKGWTDAAIALVNGGSIRESIDASSVDGTITLKDVMEVMPFDNLEVLLRIRGTVLLQALEHGVSEYVPGQAWKGAFLQLSGVHVVYDVSRPAGQRVVSAEVRCESCTIPSYAALDPNALYGVIVSGFLAGGGDGFSMLENNEGALRLENTDAVAVEDYIQKRGLVYPSLENRIVFQDAGTSTPTPTSTPAPSTSTPTPTSTPAPSTSTPTPTSTPAPSPTPSASDRALPASFLLVGALLVLLRAR